MEEQFSKMVLKHHYDRLPRKMKLKLRNEYLKKSGMSLITFYEKLRKESFKPLERELFDNIFFHNE
ncbi:MAG: hypothetical protein HUK10_01260 [Bacteroides heparinolyticus]|nr:hypothetical protein [Bacteroides heparinolyticus]